MVSRLSFGAALLLLSAPLYAEPPVDNAEARREGLVSGPTAATTDTRREMPRPVLQCLADVAERPEFHGLSKRLPLQNPAEPTVAMLASEVKVTTPPQRAAVIQWFDAWRECGDRSTEKAQITSGAPFLLPIVEKNVFKFEEVGVQLARGRISYGDAAEQMRALAQETKTEAQAAVASYQRELQQAQQAKAEQAAAQAQQERAAQQAREDEAQRYADQQRIAQEQLDMQRRALMQQAFAQQQETQRRWYEAQMRAIQTNTPQLRMPVNTNCTTYGNQTNCTSQ